MNTYTKNFSLILASILFISCGSNNTDNELTGLDTLIAYAEGNGETPTLEDYTNAGVMGLSIEELAELNEIIFNLSKEEVDSTEEVQALANNLGVDIPIIIATPTPTPTPKPIDNTAVVLKSLSKKVPIDGYLSTCEDYIEHKGKDVNANGILDESEITSSTEIHPQGEALTLDALKSKIANDEDVSAVNTCNINDMQLLFLDNGTFNQNISAWNTSAVTNMEGMFAFASVFNQNIGKWDTSSVTNMNSMFAFATVFNQNISAWDIGKVEDHTSFSTDSALSPVNSPF
jgi:surface protein